MLQAANTPEPRAFEALLGRYGNIALIANSESVNIETIVDALPTDTLFVFFTGCAKVLKAPFQRDAILCHRMVAGGKRFLKSQKHFDSAHSFFPDGLKTEIGMLADKASIEATRPTSPRSTDLVPHLVDFDYMFDSFYPAGRMPTTGFALAMWLIETLPNAKVVLCGFTGVAGTQFNMYEEHDWTFEQTVLHLFAKSGRIVRLQESNAAASQNWLSNVANRFPEFDQGEIALAAAQVLGNRFTGLERRVSKLWDQTKWQRQIKRVLYLFKRK
ncbi:hypothetical protein RMR21_005135 [Agrobacterium sp. rho-8.1]|nr:hypothetical protein [Agrobacterium sp. rho-8.1]